MAIAYSTSTALSYQAPTQLALPLSVIDDEPRIDSRIVAENLGVQHRQVLTTLNKYSDKFQGHGQLAFQTQVVSGHQGGGNPEKFALLNENQTYFLLTLVRNTEQAVDLKDKLVRAFSDCRNQLQRSKALDMTFAKAMTVDEQAANRFKCLLEVGALMSIPTHVLHHEAAKMVYLEVGIDYRPLLTHDPAQSCVTPSDMMLEPTPLAKRLGMSSAVVFNKWLGAQGWQYRENENWYATDIGKLYCADHHWTNGGKSGYNLKWNVLAIERLHSTAVA